MGNNQWLDQQVNSDFSKARLRSWLHSISATLQHEPQTLLPFEEVRSRILIRGQHDCGIQTVSVDAIIGSEGRYADFDRSFLPRHEQTKERWKSVDRAHYTDVMLPPIELYKIGEVYFVRDGNHRVSVARQQGQEFIDAHIIELVSDVPVRPTLTHSGLAALEERSDFLEWTNLAQLRPAQQIEVSQPGGYLDMIRHINGHRYFKCVGLGVELDPEAAVTSWYDTIYCPLVEAIEHTGVLAAFPGRTAADLYLWIMDHRHYLTESAGYDPGAEAATIDYARNYGVRKDKVKLPAPASKAESDFLAWSLLARLRPDARIPLNDPDGYDRLREHISGHQYFIGKDSGGPVDFEAAAISWFETIYTPIAQAICGQPIEVLFPQHSVGDLYILVTDYLHYQRGQGVEIAPAEAARQYAEIFGQERASLLTGILHRARRLIRRTLKS